MKVFKEDLQGLRILWHTHTRVHTQTHTLCAGVIFPVPVWLERTVNSASFHYCLAMRAVFSDLHWGIRWECYWEDSALPEGNICLGY